MTLEPDALILVTGANGLLSSHIIEQTLASSPTLRVRGAVRSEAKVAPLKKKWQDKYGKERFMTVVLDFMSPEAYTKSGALLGVSGIIHVVAYVAPDMQLEQASAVNVQMNLAILQAAAETPSIKRMVITSTASSTYTYQPNVELTITNKLWNEDAAKLAQTAPADDPYKMWYIYSAAKVAGDKTAWKFMEENKPQYKLNMVLPGLVFGSTLDSSQAGSTTAYVKMLFAGDKSGCESSPPQAFVNATDMGLVHLGALLSSTENRRILATATTFNWNDVLAILRRSYPDKKFVEDFVNGRDLAKIDNQQATTILKEFGKDGWKSLEQSVLEIVGKEQ